MVITDQQVKVYLKGGFVLKDPYWNLEEESERTVSRREPSRRVAMGF